MLLALVLGILLFIVQSSKNRGHEMQKPVSQVPAAEGAEKEKEEEREDETAPAPEEEEAPEDREVLTGAEIEIPLEETAGTGQSAGYTGAGQDTETPPVPVETEPADTPAQRDTASGQPSDPPEKTGSQEESGGRDDPSGGGGTSSGTGHQGVIELPEVEVP